MSQDLKEMKAVSCVTVHANDALFYTKRNWILTKLPDSRERESALGRRGSMSLTEWHWEFVERPFNQRNKWRGKKMIISGFRKWEREREIAQAKWIHAVLLVWSLQEVEQAEAEDERRLLEEEAGRLERRLDRSRNPIAAALLTRLPENSCGARTARSLRGSAMARRLQSPAGKTFLSAVPARFLKLLIVLCTVSRISR